jgi:HAD superfamily hydrolase (TIGR01549 family)
MTATGILSVPDVPDAHTSTLPSGPVTRIATVAFDVGETLIDESRLWERAADAAGAPRFTLMGVVGGLAARGEHHRRVWEILGVEQPAATWGSEDFYPDALPCLAALRRSGLRVGAVGNTLTDAEDLLREHVDLVGSSARWGVEKPTPAFFERIVAECGVSSDAIAYVGDRVDNDVEPALAAGMVAVHIRRGPWGHLHEPPPAALRISALEDLPEVLGV